MSKQVLIVEDHPVVSDSLTRIITDSNLDITCYHAPNAIKGLAYLNGHAIDMVLLDIQLPDMSGIEYCKSAKSRIPGIKVLVITTLAQRHVLEHMLQQGANGFILKTSDAGDILKGITTVLNGEDFYFGKGVKELLKDNPRSNGHLPMITRRESEILKLISDGLTNIEIAENLSISAFTVDTHRKNLLLKFDVNNTAMLIKTAFSKGYIT